VEAQRSLIADVENAIASGSADQRVETLRRVTDLFMVNVERYSEAQVEVFGDVISRLADRIEVKAREELASRLAPVANAPVDVVRALARDEAIEVAGPVLMHSPRLSDEDLVACAAGDDQGRLFAISKRHAISEVVSDVLVERGDQEVVRSVARNEGARFSNNGFGKLVERSSGDDELAVSVGLRKDIPHDHFRALISKASEAVFKRIAISDPAVAAEVNRVLFDLTGHNVNASTPVVHDYAVAKAAFDELKQSGRPIEEAVQAFAETGKFEETVVVLADLCRLPIEAVEHIMSERQADGDLVLLLIKAADMSWPTAKLILEMRGSLSRQAIDTARQHFERLQTTTAQRVVRFYQVRHASGERT
jgi:uncharacterized protein (DUF2336 family)